MPRHFAFRADAGLHIGSGHIMRCLTLSDHLASLGDRATFLTRAHEGHMIEAIRVRGHAVEVLPDPESPDYGAHPAPPVHAAWLRGDWRADARATRAWVDAARPDWLVVDHYAVDAAWQRAAVPNGTRLAVIDDLADRPHRADLLLDQNAGRQAANYDGLVPNNCTRLIGPRYALLRPEFAARRAEALARREEAKIRNILITLGGVDRKNQTRDILDALDRVNLPPEMSMTVVLGQNAPWANEVRALAAQTDRDVEVIVGTNCMADLMVTADLCIGAAGSTAWERCALGLPTLLVVMADNQREAAATLVADGAAILISPALRLKDSIYSAISRLRDPHIYRSASAICTRLVDGEGTKRVATHLGAFDIELRNATVSDGKFIWHCRNDGEAWRNYRTAVPTPLEAHLDWFGKALTSPSKIFMVASVDSQDIGSVRLDIEKNSKYAEIGISLAQSARRAGIGSKVISRTLRQARMIGLRGLTANIRSENLASHRAFLRSGFEAIEEKNGMIKLRFNL